MLKSISIIIFIFLLGFSTLGQTQQNKTAGSKCGTGLRCGRGSENALTLGSRNGVKIISKPRAIYTDIARQNKVQGKVILNVTFNKDGSIGDVKVVRGLPDGLSENAVEAAKKIRFEPQTRNGKPVTVAKNIEYNFTIY